MKRTVLWATSALCAAWGAGGAAFAQTSAGAAAETVEVITVTARLREESVQDVPLSIAVTSGVDIQNSGVKGLEELSQNLPAVNISKGGASDQLYIRGIGSGFNGGFEQAVGTYVDGVYFSRSRNTRSTFLDVDRLEVLKGPQTTFFGNSSIAGALSIATRTPGDSFGGNFTALYTPEFDETDFQGGVDVPLHETFRIRVAGRKYDTEGYYDNTNTGETTPRYDDWALRVVSVWEPTDWLDVALRYTTGESESESQFASDVFVCPTPPDLPGAPPPRPCPANLAAFPEGDPRRIDGQIDFRSQVSASEPGSQDFDYVSLTANVDVGFARLTSITARNAFENFDAQDLDQSELLIFQANQFDEFESWSQELRLTSTSSGRFSWLAGVYYQTQDIELDANLTPYFIPPIVAIDAQDPTTTIANNTLNVSTEETYSAFGALTYDLTDALRINLGLRYTEVQKDFTISNDWVTFAGTDGVLDRSTRVVFPDFPFPGFATPNAPASTSRTDSDILPTVELEYDIFDDGLLYFSFRQGFKAGGFNYSARNVANDAPPGSPNNVDSLNFGPEEVNAYEAGYKGTWFGGGLTTNVNVFFSDYTGVQQSVLDAATFVFSVDNAAASSTRGVELEGVWRATPDFELSSNVTIMDAQFDDFIGACSEDQLQRGTCGVTVDGEFIQAQDLSGRETTFAPTYSGFVRGVYDFVLPAEWSATADASVFFTDGYHIQSDLDPNIRVDAFARVNAALTVRPPLLGRTAWEFALIGKNLNDVERPFFCNDLSASPGSYRCSLNPPRSLSLQARVNF